MKQGVIEQLKTQETFFLNTVSCFSEEDSSFKPKDEIFTVAQHVGHAAETVSWFLEGTFGDKGYDMSFDNYDEKMKKYDSFESAVNLFKKNIQDATEKVESLSADELMSPITAQIMTGAPKMSFVYALGDHTAHHRGALAVYARLLGKTPKMPYAEM